jgi:4-amino-4-deoxy-L-arabinose transferase-like glycosyltransferase
MTDLLIDLLLTALVLLAIYGIGRALRRLVPLAFWGTASDLAFALAMGLGALMLMLFVLGVAGVLVPIAGWMLLGVGLALAALQWRALVADWRALWVLVRAAWGMGWFVRLGMALGLAFVLMNLFADLAPPVEGDTVHQYLLLPRYWVDAGRYFQPTHIWAATIPANGMMLSTWALLLRPSYSLATLVNGFGMSLFVALGVYALARLHFRPGPALLAAIAITTMPDAGYLAQSGKVDMVWAFFEALALAAVFRWRRDDSLDGRWLALAGVCLGLAIGSKNQTLISAALLGPWVVLTGLVRQGWRGALRAGAVFGLAALLVGAPYPVYNAVTLGNPFYPVFADQFHTWFGAVASPRSELGTEVFYPWTVWGYLRNAWNMSLGHPPEMHFYLGFIAGPIFLLAIPIGLLLRLYRGERTVWQMLAYAFVFSIIWFVVKQAARHFLPGLMLLAVAAGLALWRLYRAPAATRVIVRLCALLIFAWNLVNGLGVLYWSGAWRVGLLLETREEYLVRWHDVVITPDFPDWETITYLNAHLTGDDRILTTNATSALYIAPQLVPGNWGDRLSYEAITDDTALTARFAEEGFLAQHAHEVYAGARARLYEIIVRP